jgi:hypothetical protein
VTAKIIWLVCFWSRLKSKGAIRICAIIHTIYSKFPSEPTAHCADTGTLFLYANSIRSHLLLERKDWLLMSHSNLFSFLQHSTLRCYGKRKRRNFRALTHCYKTFVNMNRETTEGRLHSCYMYVYAYITRITAVNMFMGYSFLILRRHITIVNSVPVLCWALPYIWVNYTVFWWLVTIILMHFSFWNQTAP